MASIDFINECKNRTNANRLGQIFIDGVENPITNSDNLQSFSIDSGCYVDGNIIGSIYIKTLEGNFISVPDNIDLIDKKIQAKIGVKYSDDTTEYINMGKYIIERPNDEQTADMSQIKAYDYLVNKIDNDYVCNVDFTQGDKTVSDVYADVCFQLGLNPLSLEFTNSDIPVLGDLFEGEKNRKVLQEIGKISGSWIEIDNDTNKIKLCWLSDNEEPDYIFEKSDYAILEGSRIKYGPVNCLVIKDSQIEGENVTRQDENSIAINGETQLSIEDCYFLYTEELRHQAMAKLWEKIKGLIYTDCKLTTYYGKPFLPLGSKIRVKTDDEIYFDTYILLHKFTYDGTFESIIQSPVMTKTETEIKNTSISEKFNKIERITNKIEGKIEDVIQEVDDQNTKISNVEQTVGEISQTITEDYEFLKTKEGKQQLHLDDSLEYQPVEFKCNGNTSVEFIYPSTNLYPMSDTYSVELGEGE